jgi:glyoxylase-like metal-dependent hydrolase (beta-lactamase superfamily II)
MIRAESVGDSGQVIRFQMARVVFGRPAYYAAAYWVDGLLIDTGCAHTSRQLTAAIKSLELDKIANTHSHEDHIGANAMLQQALDCPIYAHLDALPVIANPRLQKLQAYRRIFWGMPKPSRATRIGQTLDTNGYHFEVIHTPGHSPDHICLFEPDMGWLFSGDAFIGGEDRALRQGYDIRGIIASLKKLAQLPVRVIFSGSGSVRQDGSRHLEKKIDYLEDLGQRVCALDQKGMSARQIRRKLFGPELPITYFTLGHFSGLHLVHSYLQSAGNSNSHAGSAPDEAPVSESDAPSEPGGFEPPQ